MYNNVYKYVILSMAILLYVYINICIFIYLYSFCSIIYATYIVYQILESK